MADQVPNGARVPLIAESDATGRLAEVYAEVKETTGLGFVPDMFRLVSTRPELVEVVLKGYSGIFGQGVLPRETRELIDDLPVDERTRVLLRLLTKLSRAAYAITDEDWQVALDAGWSSDDLLEAFFTAALFNFITRMVDGLGLGTSVRASRISQQELPRDEPEASATLLPQSVSDAAED